MKKALLVFNFILLSVCLLMAQAPKKMSYQGAARNASGQVLANQNIKLRLHIISGEDINNPLYSEAQNVTTNSFGLFSLKIGEGEALNGAMEDVKWGGSDHFISVEMDANNSGHYEAMGISELLSVPYAFYAEKAGTLDENTNYRAGDDWLLSGNAGTTPVTDFIGTTDAKALVFKTNGVEAMRLTSGGDLDLNLGRVLKSNGNTILSTLGTKNILIGENSGNQLTSGSYNALIGVGTGQQGTSASFNTFIGYRAGQNSNTGSSNTFIGFKAGLDNTDGRRNIFIGRNSGQNNIDGDDNTFIGDNVGQSPRNANGVTLIGTYADAKDSLFNSMAIGANAYVDQDNSIVLGSGANVGIGSSSPQEPLDVNGTIQSTGFRLTSGAVDGYMLQSDASGNASWMNTETALGWRRANNTTVYNTGDSVGINTTDPLAPLHIMGSTTLSRMILTPNEPFSGDDAEIVLTEDDDNTYNMTMTYDGGDNRMYFYGKNNANLNGPHLGINRDNGRVGIGTGTVNPVSELEVVGTVTATAFDGGDASGLSNVYADSLRGSMQADTNDLLQWNGAFWNKVPYGRYAFHASASTDQTIGDTAYDTLRCNNSSSGENFEYPAGVYDNATYGFIAPVDGIYFFEAAILWDNANLAETRNAIFLRVNNTDEVGRWSTSSGMDFFGTNISSTLELNAGDEVRVRVYNGDSAAMDSFSQSGKYCYFSGYMVFAQ